MKKAFNILIALFPILSGYGFIQSLDLGSLLLFISGVGCVLIYPQKIKINFPIGYMSFLIVAILLSLVWARSVPLQLLLFSANLCLAWSYADMKLLWKYYSVVVWLCVAFFIVQEILYMAIGSRPSGIMPFMPTRYGGDDSSRIAAIVSAGRSASFFLEPSYFAQFLIPYVAITIFSGDQGDRKRAIIVSMIVFLIRSGIGILLLGIILIIWFLFSKVKASTKVFVFVLGIGAFGILMILGSEMLDYFSRRSVELMSYTGDEQYQSSGFIRIYRGYFAFADLPVLNMIFGNHPNDVQKLLNQSIYFGTESSNFINGMQTLLLYHGIIGTFFYLRHVFLLNYKSNNKSLLALSISIVLLLLCESFYLSPRLFVIVVFMFLIRRQCKASAITIKNSNSKN